MDGEKERSLMMINFVIYFIDEMKLYIEIIDRYSSRQSIYVKVIIIIYMRVGLS